MRIHNRDFQPHEPSLNSLVRQLADGSTFFFKKKGGKENIDTSNIDLR